VSYKQAVSHTGKLLRHTSKLLRHSNKLLRQTSKLLRHTSKLFAVFTIVSQLFHRSKEPISPGYMGWRNRFL
jgi:hypothetical protein